MSAFVLVAGKPEERDGAVEAYKFGNVEAVLPLRTTYFGGAVQVWQVPDMRAAEVQADRLASGMYVALPFHTLADVQTRAREWSEM